MITDQDVARYADAVMAEIDTDMAADVLPVAVATFGELHDHVDANEYLQEAGVPFGTDPGAGADGCEAVNAVATEVSRRLAARAASLPETSRRMGAS
jgi:hypothetical protein